MDENALQIFVEKLYNNIGKNDNTIYDTEWLDEYLNAIKHFVSDIEEYDVFGKYWEDMKKYEYAFYKKIEEV